MLRAKPIIETPARPINPPSDLRAPPPQAPQAPKANPPPITTVTVTAKTKTTTNNLQRNLNLDRNHPSGPHDPTSIRRSSKPHPPTLSKEESSTLCAKGGARSKGDGDYRMLSMVKNHLPPPSQASSSKSKLFCGIYTYAGNHETQVKAVHDSWAPNCDGFAFFSTEADRSLGTVEISHDGEEGWNNMWQKVREIWSFVHAAYLEDYDYFWLGGDDVFLIVENLKKYLESEEIVKLKEGGKGLYIGSRKKEGGNMDKIFNAGGSGYILDRAALASLAKQLPICWPGQVGFWEDVNIASCLKKENVHAIDTRDELGGER